MTKPMFTRIKTLFSAVRLSLYARSAPLAKTKFDLEPKRSMRLPNAVSGFDDWMFQPERDVCARTDALARDMDGLHALLGGLRETLALVEGVTPFPSHALTQRPCSFFMDDPDLFEGEAFVPVFSQDTTIGGAASLLFDDAETAFSEPAIQQHAA